MYVRAVHTSSPPFFTYVLHKCLSQKFRFKKKKQVKGCCTNAKMPKRIRTKNRYKSFYKTEEAFVLPRSPVPGRRAFIIISCKRGRKAVARELNSGESTNCAAARMMGVNPPPPLPLPLLRCHRTRNIRRLKSNLHKSLPHLTRQ